MINVSDAFSASYAQARGKFFAAAVAANLPVSSHAHPLAGRDGEALAMDVVLDGSPDAERLLIISSACHGVEGYCGSGVQVAALHDEAWRQHAREKNVAVLYVHALNPFGFSHVRRATHENVDINRNFHDFSQPLPVNLGYRRIHSLLLPDHWPPGADNEAAIAAFIEKNGASAFQSAVSSGQHEFPDGLFLVAPSRPGATGRFVRCCVSMAARHTSWPGLTFTPVWVPVVWASAFLPARMTRQRMPVPANGGVATVRLR